jgi:hypothetical protein
VDRRLFQGSATDCVSLRVIKSTVKLYTYKGEVEVVLKSKLIKKEKLQEVYGE